MKKLILLTALLSCCRMACSELQYKDPEAAGSWQHARWVDGYDNCLDQQILNENSKKNNHFEWRCVP